MSGEFDSLRVKIESNSDKAKNNISYLIVALNDLRRVLNRVVPDLRDVNSLLREMSDSLKGIKSVGDPFKAFSQGADRASRNADKFREAMRGGGESTKESTTAMTVWGRTASTALDRVARKAKQTNRSLYGTSNKGIKDGQKLIGEVPIDTHAQVRDPGYEVNDKWRDAWARINDYKYGKPGVYASEQKELNKAYEYFANLKYSSPKTGINTDDITKNVTKSAKDLSILKPIFESVKKSALSLVNTLAKIPKAIGSGAVKVMTAPFKAVGNAISGAVGKAKSFFASIKRIAVYRAIRSALKAMTQAFQEGIGNLYQWSAAVGTSFAPAMDSIATSLLYLKNGFAAMFSPIIEYVAPLIQKLADTLVDAFNWVQKLLSQLLGRDHWYKAVRVQTQYAEKTDDTTKAVKKLRQEIQLMDWDEINNITENTDDGNGGVDTTPTQPNPADMFVQVAQPLEKLAGDTFWQRLWGVIKRGWDKLKEWWNGVDWENLGKKIGEKITGWWNKATDWWNEHKGEIGEGIVKVAGDIYNFFKGLFEGIDFRKIADDLGTFIGDLWKGFSGWFSEHKHEIWQGIVDIVTGIWDFLKTAFDAFMRVIDPYYDTKQKAKETTKVAAQAVKDADSISGNYSGMSNEEAYEAATNDIEQINKSVRELTRGREQLNTEIKNLLTDETGFYDDEKRARYDRLIAQQNEAVANGQDRDKEFSAEFANNEEFKAYVKLKGALDQLETAYTKVTQKRKQIAHTAQMLAGIEVASFTTANKKIQNALIRQNDILTSGMGELAADALDSYITSVDWGNGGVITVKGIVDALYKAGLDKEWAEEAGRDIFGYLTGTYNGYGWHDVDQESVEVIKNSISEANIPGEYMDAAEDALMSYVSSVDWENGGFITAEGIKNAFIGVGIPEEVARQAALSVVQWYTKFNPDNVGEVTARKMIKSLQDQLNLKAKTLKIILDGVKIPSITIPVNYKLPKALLQQKIEVNYRGSAGNIIQQHKGTVEAYFMAQGGFVPKQGTLFVSGEVPGEAEMIGNINGKTGVVSGREISGIGDAVWSTGNTTAQLLENLINLVASKELVISPSATLGKVVAKSNRLYATQTG